VSLLGKSLSEGSADFISYKIAESYYSRAKDKKQAVEDILEIKDFNQFLKASGYDEKFSA